MTTIAYDGRLLVYDTQTQDHGNCRVPTVSEKVSMRLHDGMPVLVALCGTTVAREALADWFVAGCDAKAGPPLFGEYLNWFGIVITPHEFVSFSNEMSIRQQMRPPVFMGSGGAAAQGAYASGASIVEAMQAAIRVDINSGGPIHVIDVPRLFKTYQFEMTPLPEFT